MSAQCIHGVGTSNFVTEVGVGAFLSNITLIGQTFTADATGNVTSISIGAGSSTTAATHELRIGTSSNPPTSEIGGGVYQTFSTSGGNETVTINISPPFPVTAGLVYAFDITFSTSPGTVWDNLKNTSDDYSGGNYYELNPSFSNFSGDDSDFEVCISPSPAAIPTLSEWGLLILALLLMTLGTVYLLQPQWREGLNRNS